MSRFIYTAEMLEFIAAQYKLNGFPEVTAAFNKKFESHKTVPQIRAAIKNHKIICGRKTGELNKGVLRQFTTQQAEWIKQKYTELSLSALTAAFNAEFESNKTVQQIRSFTRNHSIKSGRSGRFDKGQQPWNTGMKGWCAGGRSAETRFKKGQALNTMPLGSERVCSKDGYVMIKVAMPNKWRMKHVVEWEKHNGPIPKGYRIWFKDNVRTNWAIENLMLITRAQGAVINKMGLGTVPAELKTAAVTMADISMKRRKLSTSKQEQAA
jgi:hypothetical protein